MIEEWRAVPGYSDYLISNFGRVAGFYGFLDPSIDRYGYFYVDLYSTNGRNTKKKIHRLVALAFIGPSNLTVHHKDSNKRNNRLDNLEYVSSSRNLELGHKEGRFNQVVGENNRNSKLTKEAILFIRGDVGKFWTKRRLAEKFNVSTQLIGKVIRNEIWRHIKA